MSEETQAAEVSLDSMMDAIHAEATGKEVKQEEKPVEATPQDTLAGGEEQGIEEEAPEDESGEAEEPEAKPEKARSKMIPRDRFDKVNEDKKALEDAVRQMQAENAELKALVKQSLSGEKKEAKQQKKEWLDPEAQEEFEGTKEEIEKFKAELKDELKTEKFVGGFREMELAAAKEDPLYEQKIDHLIALDAADILATSNVSQKEAIERAATNYLTKCRALFDGGKNPALYMKGRAEMLFPQFRQTEQPKQKKASVNMSEMQKLRDSAGAPTNKSVASNVAADMDSMMASIHKESKEARGY